MISAGFPALEGSELWCCADLEKQQTEGSSAGQCTLFLLECFFEMCCCSSRICVSLPGISFVVNLTGVVCSQAFWSTERNHLILPIPMVTKFPALL